MTSVLVPKTYNVSLNGRNYIVDLAQPFYRQLRRTLEPLIRTQADTSNYPGEQTMDPNGLWRRSFEDWRNGAGQRYIDRNTSQDNAYWQSKGVDTLTNAWQVSLLPDTANVYSSTNTNLQMVWAAGYVWIIDGATVKYTAISNITPGATPSWTTVAGMPGTTISSVCTDGNIIYMACGASGIVTLAGAFPGSPNTYVSAGVDANAVVGFGNGRLMLGSTNNLYNIVASGALPIPLEVYGNTNARVSCVAQGNNWLYVGVNVGGIGYVYGVQTTADGTALSPPVVQTQLPNGEKLNAMYGYLGFLVLGTNLGVRLCQQGSTGVTLGTLIPTPNPVMSLSAWGPFIWFGWTNYDGTSTGTGKISLENFVVSNILPAYASDRMATAQGIVNSITILNGFVMFAVIGQGIYLDSNNLVTSGTIQSGYILFDLTDPKCPALIDVQGAGIQAYGSYSVSLSTDGGAFSLVGTSPVGSLITRTFQITSGPGSRFEVLLTLLRDAVAPTQGPTLTRWTLRSYPAPLRPKTWQLPLVLDEHVVNASGQASYFDPEVEINALEAMANSGEPVYYQEGSETYLVFVTDVSFIATDTTMDRHYFNGIALVNIQSVPVPS